MINSLKGKQLHEIIQEGMKKMSVVSVGSSKKQENK